MKGPLSQIIDAQPVVVDQHFSPQFFAELWGVDRSTVTRWFQDMPGVLKLGEPGKKKRARVELRIPFSLAMQEYRRRAQS